MYIIEVLVFNRTLLVQFVISYFLILCFHYFILKYITELLIFSGLGEKSSFITKSLRNTDRRFCRCCESSGQNHGQQLNFQMNEETEKIRN